jgi:GAF domain-containing protein
MPAETPNEIRHARGSGGQPAEAGLARQLSELAREMQADPDMAALLKHIVVGATTEVAGAEHAGISLIEGTHIRTEAATDELVERIDEQQYELQQGPCLEALRHHVTVRSDDFEHEGRWPGFAEAAMRFGVQSMLSVQLFVEGSNLGVLNMYAMKPNAFTDHDESVAILLAAHAAIAMKGSTVEANLRTALESRDTIGQAKGILMERFKVGQAEAFALLVVASQHTHRKSRDVADTLTSTGELQSG